MHQTGFLGCYLFFQVLHLILPKSTIFYNSRASTNVYEYNILDVGSLDVNGTNRDCIDKSAFGRYRKYKYIGIDRIYGPNVDYIFDAESGWPFGESKFDIILSTSFLEKDDIFWVTFHEMSRSLKHGGFIYINVAAGTEEFERFSMGSYRFFPDSARSLSAWVKNHSIYPQNLEVIHASMLNIDWRNIKKKDSYSDTNMIYWKGGVDTATFSNSWPLNLSSIEEIASCHDEHHCITKQLEFQFSFYKIDLIVLVSNFVSAISGSDIEPVYVQAAAQSEIFPSDRRGVFPGVYPLDGKCIFDIHVDGSKYNPLALATTSSIGWYYEYDQLLSLEDINILEREFYYEIFSYFSGSRSFRSDANRLMRSCIYKYGNLKESEKVFVSFFQAAPPLGGLYPIHIPKFWLQYYSKSDGILTGPLQEFLEAWLSLGSGPEREQNIKSFLNILDEVSSSN